MKYIGYTNPKLLIAEEGYKIKDINDIYISATETEKEHIPYYTDIIFLPSNVTQEEIFSMYIEEKREE